jgi:hypothetical protein
MNGCFHLNGFIIADSDHMPFSKSETRSMRLSSSSARLIVLGDCHPLRNIPVCFHKEFGVTGPRYVAALNIA